MINLAATPTAMQEAGAPQVKAMVPGAIQTAPSRGAGEAPTPTTTYVAPDSKLLGMFAANNPAQAHLLLPQNSNLCADFCFKGLECEGVKTEICPTARGISMPQSSLT